MVNCANCSKKIGFFEKEYNYLDKNGDNHKYCSKCNLEYQKKEDEKKLKNLTKKNFEEQKLEEQKLNEITEICKKYLLSKDSNFKGIIIGIYTNEDFLKLIEKDNLDSLKKTFTFLLEDSQENKPSNAYEYDEVMETENTLNLGWEYIQDLEKLKKILDKKNLKFNYIKLIELMVNLVNEEINEMSDEVTLPAYKRISKITTDKKQIIKEYLKFDTPDEMLIENLFDRFKLDYTKEEVANLLNECIEETELENFEENLGIKQKKQIGDFNNLNGHQFEDYLKDLFLALDYQVIRTKLSGDQGADLIIKKENEKIVVQAKKYSGSVTNKAIQEVVASKEHYGANKAMVITTGNFTKSAIELAKSNKVELWDRKKLESIISNINNSSNTNKINTKTEQLVSLEEDYFPTFCPFCKSEIKLKLDDLPKKNTQKTIKCPVCTVENIISIPQKYYSCIGCKREFETLKERIKHTKECKKVKEREFNCVFCKKYFRLDDNEIDELTKKRTLKVKCPACNKSSIIKKK